MAAVSRARENGRSAEFINNKVARSAPKNKDKNCFLRKRRGILIVNAFVISDHFQAIRMWLPCEKIKRCFFCEMEFIKILNKSLIGNDVKNMYNAFYGLFVYKSHANNTNKKEER